MSDADFVDELRAIWSDLRPDIDTESAEIFLRLHRAVRLSERATSMNTLAQYGLSRPELDLLFFLRRSQTAVTPSAISDALLFSPAATTKRLDQLEARGHLSRRAKPGDRRGSLIELTPAGIEFVNELFPRMVAQESALLSGVAPAEREAIRAALRTLVEALDKARMPAKTPLT